MSALSQATADWIAGGDCAPLHVGISKWDMPVSAVIFSCRVKRCLHLRCCAEDMSSTWGSAMDSVLSEPACELIAQGGVFGPESVDFVA
jgi:hypothetical protein